tara:strand:- start:187 stop:510 length:324 start_codon:yes stop_codon:yes gene_type:complete
MTTEKTQDKKYTQDGITFKSKEDWENYNATFPYSDKGVLNDNINTNQSNNENKGTQTVKISDIKMPFGSMVVFMVKWAIASIPAIIILMILFAIFGGFFVSIISMFN